MFKPFYIIYILVGFNHLSMKINFPLIGLVWDIANLANILCEPLLH